MNAAMVPPDMEELMNLAAQDFSKATRSALSKRGMTVVGIQMIPDNSHPMPWTNAERAYLIDDNGTGRVVSFGEVLKLAGKR